MSGEEKLKQIADSLRKDVDEEIRSKEVKKRNIEEDLGLVGGENKELSVLFKENAHLGAANISGQLPLLKIHSSGKSWTNKLSDGLEPTDGCFFHKPTQREFSEIDCYILTISKGYYSKSLEKDKKDVFSQIVGGVIIDELTNELIPFVTFFSGKRLSKLWDFAKQVGFYVNSSSPIPMFCLKVHMNNVKEKNDLGSSWITYFKILKNDNGLPITVSDIGEFNYLKDLVNSSEQMIQSMIKNKSTDEIQINEVENIDIDDTIPF